MRLIDADAFANRIVSVYGEDGLPKDASLIYELLLNRPTIDAEPVVRCIDCIFRYDCEYSFKSENGFCCCGAREQNNEECL